MTAGDHSLTNLGSYDISGSALKDAVDGVSLTGNQMASGSKLIFVPAAGGQQIQLLKLEVAIA